jgi:hypothetical protein
MLTIGLDRQVSTPSSCCLCHAGHTDPVISGNESIRGEALTRCRLLHSNKKLGSGLPPSSQAEVSPNLAEFTQGVSYPGAQII